MTRGRLVALFGTETPLGRRDPRPDTELLARLALGVATGKTFAEAGVSALTASVTEGVVRTMMLDRMKYGFLVALVAAGLIGFGLSRWASAGDGPKEDRRTTAEADPKGALRTATPAKDKEPADDGRPAPLTRRREAVIRLPVGTFVKEVDAAPYGGGRLTVTYEEDRVLMNIEGSVMGAEFVLALEAEYALSSNGTIYGLLTNARLEHLRLPAGEPFGDLQAYAGLWPVLEPVVNDVLTDLPFSYKFRLQGERLVRTRRRNRQASGR